MAYFGKKSKIQQKQKNKKAKKAPRNGGNPSSGPNLHRMRSHGDRVLAAGAAEVTASPWGIRDHDAQKCDMACWDAKLLSHLALPRAVGPYCIIRTTKRFRSSAAVTVIGTFQQANAVPTSALTDHWTSVCAVQSVNENVMMGAANNTIIRCMDLTKLGESATMVPSAISVQVMNPNPLQTTAGMIYGGVMSTQAQFGGSFRPWTEFAEEFVQFQCPRLMAASKLALRGVQANSYPLNMAKIADFLQSVYHSDDPAYTWDQTLEPGGWSPIVVYNPRVGDNPEVSTPGPELEYLITTEWRVRFDVSSPAVAAHRSHKPATDTTWSKMLVKAGKLGNGFLDIADRVANIGQTASRLGMI